MLRSLVHMESATNGCVTNEKENLREVQTCYLTPDQSFGGFVIHPYSDVTKVWREVFFQTLLEHFYESVLAILHFWHSLKQ